jgi:mono/diheme cytochrome c family protein
VRPLAAAVLLALAAAAQGGEIGGAALDYAVNCQGCHRADGAATPGTVPGLAGEVARFLAVPGGREYLVQVPGVAQATLDDVALARVMNWMLDRFDKEHLPAGFVPYTADEVGRLRKSPLTDVERTRHRLVATREPAPRP